MVAIDLLGKNREHAVKRTLMAGLRPVAATLFVALTLNGPLLAQTTGTSPSPSLIVQTENGALQGVNMHGVENFLNIPYAASPVGPLRWSPPQPAPRWSGIRSAGTPGSYCPQPKSLDSAQTVTDEDCLTLNVQRPIGAAAGAGLPVLVYLHGGGFVTGSGVKDQQDKIARLNGIIGVSVNYRLGVLGFLALPGLKGGGDFGIEDQQAALRWVRSNIAAFGGDAGKVTIAGESAGGWSVCMHLVAPGSRGLFAKAIIQSGTCASQPIARAETAGTSFAAKLGCAGEGSPLACLRGKPVAELLAAQDGLYVPARGNDVIPTDPKADISAGHFTRVPILIGSMRDEGRSFSQDAIGWNQKHYISWINASFGSQADNVLLHYPWPAKPSDQNAAAYRVADVRTDASALGAGVINGGVGSCGTAQLSAGFARAVPVYVYEFSHRSGPGWYAIPGYRWGAGHAAELPYLYPLHDGGKTYAAFTPQEKRLSDDMAGYWGAFATHGKPDAAGRTIWPEYAKTRQILSLDTGTGTRPISLQRFRTSHQCDFWDRLSGVKVQ